jgi:hypothetical protein
MSKKRWFLNTWRIAKSVCDSVFLLSYCSKSFNLKTRLTEFSFIQLKCYKFTNAILSVLSNQKWAWNQVSANRKKELKSPEGSLKWNLRRREPAASSITEFHSVPKALDKTIHPPTGVRGLSGTGVKAWTSTGSLPRPRISADPAAYE